MSMSETSSRSSMDGWAGDLKRLEKVLVVYEDLGGEYDERLTDLVTPYRRFVSESKVFLKLAPFSTSKMMPRSLYLFDDLIILAQQPKSILSSPLRKSSSSTPKPKRNNSGFFSNLFRSSSKKEIRERESSVTSAATMERKSSSSKRKLTMTHKLDLSKTTVKSIPHQVDGMFGLQITYVQRIEETVMEGDKPKVSFVTKIEKMEIWLDSDDDRKFLFSDIQAAIDQMNQEEIRRRTSSGAGSDTTQSTATTGTTSTGKTPRKWANAARIAHARHGRGISSSSVGSAATAETAKTLGLKDLEERYKVETADYTNADQERRTFLVQFGEGPMGFSLSSGEGVGVVVGRLAHKSFAELGGVNIGDRLTAVNDVEIGLDVPWKRAVEIIKEHQRPITLKFERFSAVAEKMQAAEQSSRSVAASTVSDPDAEPKPAGTPRLWRRRQAEQRSKMGGNQLLNLKELEKMYKGAEKTGDDKRDATATFNQMANRGTETERKCVSVLQEMYATEKAYVEDLRTLVGQYILPLRRATQHVMCRDIVDESRLCEHKLIRSTCSKQSIRVKPLLDPEELQGIFMNVETLVQVNTELLHMIQHGMVKLARDGKVPTVAKVVAVYAPAFIKVMPFFKMYSLYCHQYTSAIDKLVVCRTRNPELHELLLQREKRSQQSSLQSLLIKPVQRICKYPLLFNELIKNIMPYVQEAAATGESYEALTKLVSDLETATQTVQKIAAAVNQKVGEKDNLERLMEVYVELGGEAGVPGLVQPSRRFLSSFDVNYRGTPFDDKNEMKRTMVYVFNDLLLLARGTSNLFNARMQSSSSLGSLPTASSSGTLKKSISSLMQGASSAVSRASHRSGERQSGRGSSTGRSSSGRVQQLYKVTHWMDLRQVQIQANTKADAGTSFVMKHVERLDGDQVTIKKNGTLKMKRTNTTGNGPSHRRSSDGSNGPVVTSINKYEIWCRDAQQRNELFTLITKMHGKIADLDEGQRSAEAQLSPHTRKPKAWRRHRHTRSGSQHSSESDKATVLQAIEKKYTANSFGGKDA